MQLATRGGVSCMEDVAALAGVDMQTLNENLPPKSTMRRSVEQTLEMSRRKTLISIRQHLFSNGSPTALLSMYKMYCTQEERDALNSVKADITSNGKDIKADPIVIEIIDKASQVEQKED